MKTKSQKNKNVSQNNNVEMANIFVFELFTNIPSTSKLICALFYVHFHKKFGALKSSKLIEFNRISTKSSR